MNLERFCLKFFAHSGAEIDDAIFIDIFHEWIRHKKLGGILLDVADYRHVPDGPGIMLITHEINFAMDYGSGRFGLYAQRKLGRGQNQVNRILELIRATAAFGALLENDPRLTGALKLEAGNFHFISNDRLLAPNRLETFDELRPALHKAAALVYPGQAVSLTRLDNDPRDRLTVAIDSGLSLGIGALLETIGVAA